MTKIAISLCILLSFLIFLSISEGSLLNSEIFWNNHTNGIKENNINCILIDSKDVNIVFVATNKSIYFSKDSGKYYKRILSISGKDSKVNFLFQDINNPKILYSATSDGLYQSLNYGKSWKRIFRGINKLQRHCNYISVINNSIILATKEGLFYSLNNAKTWNNFSGELGRLEIVSIALGKNNIYVAAASEIYTVSLDLKEQKKLFSLSLKESDIEEEDNGYDYEEEQGLSRINDIKVELIKSQKVYLATDIGLFYSENSGLTWQRFDTKGLLSNNIKAINLDSEGSLSVGTDKGVFGFINNRWQQLYKGISTNKINYLAADSQGNIWAATGDGVFKGSSSNSRISIEKDELGNILESFKDEPSIQEIQKQAIEYAEVQPEKIKLWRKSAAKSAWLPKLTIGVDGDDNLTISDSVWGSYSSGGQNYVGPDDKTYYNNTSWDVSLSWDFSELIWSSDQTSIDSRSKLMVELREDILDEVTRLYFERRRLQTELLISPPEEASVRLDRQLRLEELTASIDGLTGGYLSKRLQEANDSVATGRTASSF